MDLVEFADKVRPLLDELEGARPERLASLITSAVIANPLPSDEVIAAFCVASKVLTEYAEEARILAACGGSDRSPVIRAPLDVGFPCIERPPILGPSRQRISDLLRGPQFLGQIYKNS